MNFKNLNVCKINLAKEIRLKINDDYEKSVKNFKIRNY